ncbi:MAG: glycosyltransferase family 39 protein [Candidatus Woesebacteria bacterium]|nr:MAG: glycosyltransferase family 39 protein [Candidatus Woesebacteria bacterium]
MKKQKIILILIVILAFCLRFYKLNSYPALNADEASIGYDAYSLIKTGRDQHGNSWPLQFQSFNDYKPGLYVYIVLPFVKFLSLNEWSIRIPSAFLGVATVYIIYLLIKELFNDEKFALIGSFLLAISPWHLHFSRSGWEVNIATFFITLGLLFFFKAIKKQKFSSFFFSVLFFVLSMYTYHSARIVVPFLGIGLFYFYLKDLKKNLKLVSISVIIFGLLIIPITNKDALSRAGGVSIFSDKGIISGINEQRGEGANSTLTKILHNKVINYSLIFADNYSKHFWGEFLFLSGDVIQRNRVPETGQLYLFEIITLSVGIYFIIKKTNKEWGLIIFWLIISPAAAALTFQSPHALRAHNMVIPLTIISSYGLMKILNLLKNLKIKNIFLLGNFLILIFISWCVARYLHEYYIHMSKEYPYSSQYGVKEMVSYLSQNQGSFQKIFVTDRYDQPYILYLFYTKTDPSWFQKNHNLTAPDKFGFSTVRDVASIHFESIDFEKLKQNYPNSLIIGDTKEIPKEANIIKKIYGANGFLYFEVVKN